MVDLSVTFCGITFKNPLVLASGIWGVTGANLRRALKTGAGGVTTKSIWLHPHKGHPNPTMFGTDHYFINAVGLPDGGIDKAKEEIEPLLKENLGPVIVNIVGGKKEDFVAIAERIIDIQPQLLELNISCPNVADEFGRPFACVASEAAELTAKVKKAVGKIPVIVKLTPNVDNLMEVAKACEAAGADALNMGNTFGPGLVIDIEVRKPILANRFGGVSGPGLKPLVVKNIYDIYRAVKIPILGTGSVLTASDAIELMMAGASLVGIGTALFYQGISVFSAVTKGMTEWCEKQGVKRIEEIVGCAHK